VREKALTHGCSGTVHHRTDLIFLGNQKTVAKYKALLWGFKNSCSDATWARLEEHFGWSLPCAAHSVNLRNSHSRR